MNHATTRATILPEIIKMISEKYNISEMNALDKFYTSATGASFADDETGNRLFGLGCAGCDPGVCERLFAG